jgi:hypothetical protein
MKADGGAHTKWFWCELLTILAGSLVFLWDVVSRDDGTFSRWSAYTALAVSIAPSCVRAAWRHNRAPGDRKRAVLLLLAGLGQGLFYTVEYTNTYIVFNAEEVQNASLWSIGVVACAGFVVMMFWMDRRENIEHSVPYAVAYAWALSASVLGASYTLGLFYRYEKMIYSVFGSSSTFVSQLALTLFSSVVLWVFGKVSGSITTARDHTVFMLPGLFAVVD